MTTLNPVAVSGARLLRAINDQPAATKKEWAETSGRKDNNMSRDLGVLETAGLIAPDPWRVTDEGQAQLAAIDRAEGEAVAPTGQLTAMHAELKPNPLNPRQLFDADGLANLAETIRDRGVMQNLVVTPKDADGRRIILDGERRWRAVGLLLASSADAFPFDFPMPIVEREMGEDDALAVSLVLNGQHAHLTKVEDAKALHALVERHGWSARQAAFKVGRAREGAEGGVKAVQESVKVIREAAPEDVARFERREVDEVGEWTWKRLLATVQTEKPEPAPQLDLGAPALTLSAKLALAMVEIADACFLADGEISIDGRFAGDIPNGAWDTLAERGLIQIKRPTFTGDLTRVTVISGAAWTWLDANGFNADRRGLMFKLRLDVLGAEKATALAQAGRYATDWLNPPIKAAGAGDLSPPPPADIKGPNPDEATVNNPDDLLMLVELAHKLNVPMHAYPLPGGRTGVLVNRLLANSPSGARRIQWAGWAFLTDTFDARVAMGMTDTGREILRGLSLQFPTDADLARLQAEGGYVEASDGEDPYVFDFLSVDDPCIYAGKRFANTTHATEARMIAEGRPVNSGSSSKPRDQFSEDIRAVNAQAAAEAAEVLTGPERLAMLELAAKLAGEEAFNIPNSSWRVVPVGEYWKSATFTRLQSGLAFVAMANNSDGAFMRMTLKGEEWLKTQAEGWTVDAHEDFLSDYIEAARTVEIDGAGWETPWLNTPAAAAEASAPAIAAGDFHGFSLPLELKAEDGHAVRLVDAEDRTMLLIDPDEHFHPLAMLALADALGQLIDAARAEAPALTAEAA